MLNDVVHTPVLLQEVLAHIEPQPGDRVIDATVDGGGHTGALLERIGPAGAVLGIDRDPTLVDSLRSRLVAAVGAGQLVVVAGSFRRLNDLAIENGFTDVKAVLFDLGLSSHHLDRSGRGFSYQPGEPLDMRFAPAEEGETAADIVATRTAAELTTLFREYGEERFASRIARNILAARARAPVTTTEQLVELIAQVLPGKERHRAGRSAARVFQALRIQVNDELDAIREALPQAVDLLAPGGRLVVIAFHSLEDRIVKRFLLEARSAGQVTIVTKRPIRPSDAEIIANPRAASAKLRVAVKV